MKDEVIITSAVFGLGVFSMVRRHALVSLRHALIWCAMLPPPSAMLPFFFRITILNSSLK